VSGLGLKKIEDNGDAEAAKKLQKATIPIIPPAVCKEKRVPGNANYYTTALSGDNSETRFCAGYENGVLLLLSLVLLCC
jgi:hypothetical protein